MEDRKRRLSHLSIVSNLTFALNRIIGAIAQKAMSVLSPCCIFTVHIHWLSSQLYSSLDMSNWDSLQPKTYDQAIQIDPKISTLCSVWLTLFWLPKMSLSFIFVWHNQKLFHQFSSSMNKLGQHRIVLFKTPYWKTKKEN